MSEVEIYTTAFCPYCHMAKSLLDRKGVDYVEHDVTMDQKLRAKMTERAEGRRTVPQIFIAGTPIGGFDDLAALDRGGKLDPMLAAAN